jgi:pimeloyl-ACP methyl ester carboxylesterase
VSDVSHRTLKTNGINMHIAEMGDGPLVLLIHGWPESWYSWRHQLPALAAAGYHAVAPDVRGYGRTDAPAPVEAYSMKELTWWATTGARRSPGTAPCCIPTATARSPD